LPLLDRVVQLLDERLPDEVLQQIGRDAPAVRAAEPALVRVPAVVTGAALGRLEAQRPAAGAAPSDLVEHVLRPEAGVDRDGPDLLALVLSALREHFQHAVLHQRLCPDRDDLVQSWSLTMRRCGTFVTIHLCLGTSSRAVALPPETTERCLP
jgi:hypothetical protein